MFVVELGFGLRTRSTGLIAASLDRLADAAVTALSLLAANRSTLVQRRTARVSGVTPIALAGWVDADGWGAARAARQAANR
ncbi:MAG: hypothetical protein VKI42_06565 [Synechococcaceae cyanobacterium]|nr:hypothetical protein [Synechococcaceae cyanobacterium]